ncbi:uncharacterized protein LOC110455430 isoform X1 [Mizuhopecten yessoensis]|uniref:uncharacterized protein LOC110455430 isoform X1 n=1 Tax=Mizuhopecten yessoensis TaxID=6573 RepID=UPI000B45C44E|nr:uncharacterized protein LOC110455430 isoform X1 [Mizuhopecten yessoensis]
MFGVIASSAGCKGPSHSSSSSNKHQSNHDNHQCRGSQDIKDRDTFITPEELFQIIANKRNAELINNRHKHSPRCIHSDHSFFTPQEKSGHHKNKESSSKKHGAFSINQAIGTSLSCVGGSQQFARELGIKASVAPKT